MKIVNQKGAYCNIFLFSIFIFFVYPYCKSYDKQIFSIGEANYTELEWELRLREYQQKINNNYSLESLAQEIIDKKILIAEAYNRRYNEDERVVNNTYFTSKFMLLQKNGPLFSEFIKSHFHVTDSLFEVNKRKGKTIFFFSSSDDKLFSTKSEFVFGYPSLLFWEIQDSLYYFQLGQIKYLTINEKSNYVRLDSIKISSIELANKQLEDILLIIEKEKFLKNFLKDLSYNLKINIDEFNFAELLGSCVYNKGLHNLYNFKSDHTLFTYSCQEKEATVPITDFIHSYKNTPVKEIIDNENMLSSSIHKYVFDELLYEKIVESGFLDNYRFIIERRLFKEKKMVAYMLDDIVNENSKFTESTLKEYYYNNLDEFIIEDSVKIYKIIFSDLNIYHELRNKKTFQEKFTYLRDKPNLIIIESLYNYPIDKSLQDCEVYASIFYSDEGRVSIPVLRDDKNMVLLRGRSFSKKTMDFDDVRERIKQALVNKKKTEVSSILLRKYKERYNIKIEAIKKMLLEKIQHNLN